MDKNPNAALSPEKRLKVTGRDPSSAHFQHTQEEGYPPPFYSQIYGYIPLEDIPREL